MNAPQRIAPARDKYIPIVRHHLPACEGDEMTLRCSILMLRDQATAGMRRCSNEAHGVLAEIDRLATLYVFRSMPISEVKELRYRLTMLTACASGLEMFAYRLSGGTDGRG